jgi:hypothetical protein
MPALFAVTLLSATSVFSQNKDMMVQAPAKIITPVNTPDSGYAHELAKMKALENVDIAVGGKSITIGQFFPADDEGLQNLTGRVKDISILKISLVQMNLFLTELMPGGPLVTHCFGCGDVVKGQA